MAGSYWIRAAQVLTLNCPNPFCLINDLHSVSAIVDGNLMENCWPNVQDTLPVRFDTEWFCGVYLLLSIYGSMNSCQRSHLILGRWLRKCDLDPYGSKLLRAELGFNHSLSHRGEVKSSLKSPALPKGPGLGSILTSVISNYRVLKFLSFFLFLTCCVNIKGKEKSFAIIIYSYLQQGNSAVSQDHYLWLQGFFQVYLTGLRGTGTGTEG